MKCSVIQSTILSLVAAVNLLGAGVAYATASCHEFYSDLEQPPFGTLTLIQRNRRSQEGGIFVDQRGVKWYLKEDTRYPELQTASEVISAEVYRHFGYLAPKTFITDLNGKRHSASRYYENLKDLDFKTELPDTPHFRGMRIVSAFLKDWDRRVQGNNKKFPDGRILHLDFGGTLGSRSQGEFKPGDVFSAAVGAFKSPDIATTYTRNSIMASEHDFLGQHPMKELFDGYIVSMLPESHPWKKMTIQDARLVIEYFRTLDSVKLESIVDQARFTSARDKNEMFNSLVTRRNAFLEYLEGYLGGSPFPTDSYWAKQSAIEELSFTVRDNRSTKIGDDVKAYVDRMEPSPEEIILFRGQAELTEKILAPGYHPNLRGQTLMDPKVDKDRVMEQAIHSAFRDLNHIRHEQLKYMWIGGTGDRPFWDRASAMDLLVHRHSVSNGLDIFVSTTRRLDVASRWVQDSRFSTKYRYVYVLSVPKDIPIPVTRVLKNKKSRTNDEAEWVIPFDATPFIKGVYDTFENRFLDKPGQEP